MKKRFEVYLILILLISILGIVKIDALTTSSGIWHDEGNISVIKQSCPSGTCLWSSQWIQTNVKLKDITPLKNAISWTFNYLDYINAAPAIGGHSASQIWVKVRPTLANMYTEEMTLLQALKTAWGLCAPDDITNLTYSGPTNKTQAYHYGTEIAVTIDGITESLQDAINNGVFCYNYYWATGTWSKSGGGGADDYGSCGTITQTRTVTCMRNDGTAMADSYCTEAKPATSQTFYHQCYLHLMGGGTMGVGE
ncbi:Uncharacterised protein [uncultured archaeon]|nr:Uncharacterised protein [uncultured archaeon]